MWQPHPPPCDRHSKQNRQTIQNGGQIFTNQKTMEEVKAVDALGQKVLIMTFSGRRESF